MLCTFKKGNQVTTLFINNKKYEISCVIATKKAFNKNIGVHLQLQVFKDGVQIDKNEISVYAMEKIEEHFKEII